MRQAGQLPLHDEGESVPVLYPPEEPAKGLLADFSGMWFHVCVRAALAIACFVGAWIAFKLPGMMDDQRPSAQNLPA